MKKLSQLIQDCKEKGIPIPEGDSQTRDCLIQRLAEYHLQQTNKTLPPLEQISPQLAKDIKDLSEQEREEVLKSDRYVCGEKMNGIRGILHIRPEGNRFTSRNRCSDTYLLNELTENLPHLHRLGVSSWEGSIFDGELYLKGDFIKLHSLANTLEATSAMLHCSPEKAREFQNSNGNQIHYHIFDVIRRNGQDLTSLPFRQRLKHLNEFKRFVQSSGFKYIEFEQLIFEGKEQYFREVIKAGGEGIVLKDLNGSYHPGIRSSSWLKVKRASTVDAIIIGSDRGKEWNKKGLIGSIELGIFDECGDLRSIGRVSSMPLRKRVEMTEIVDGIPSLRREYIGTIVECRFQELNKNLRARHLQVVTFRDGLNSKPISECYLNLSKEKEKLTKAGVFIPDPINKGHSQILKGVDGKSISLQE